jgi:inorganic pyrophosphatase
MAFPYDFGFVPSTLADDGDPVDVLVLMDEPAFTGCLLTCRLIGIIEARQRDDDGWVRNDRIVAVESNNHSFASIRRLADLGKVFVKELEEFFVNYHDLDDEKFEIVDAKGPDAARQAIKRGKRKAARRHGSRTDASEGQVE